ncbi:MAG: hypothetical protein K0S33_3137 [Bacteroidetes bacterium]|jgi:hypothetical protein|nr:hypothetical protein [Bacteroidota bacterium]
MRKVPFAVLTKLFIEKPFSYLIIICTLFPTLIIIPIIAFVVNIQKDKHEKYDYEDISVNGMAAKAKIRTIDTMNVSVGGESPVSITYEYSSNGKRVVDKFETFDLDRINSPWKGSTVIIKHLNGKSVIQGLNKFNYPYIVFYAVPLLFIILVLPFFLLFFISSLKRYLLYKNGEVKDATIISVEEKSGLPIGNIGERIIFSYSYIGNSGAKEIGVSTEWDFLLLYIKAGNTVRVFVSSNGKRTSLVPALENKKYGWNIT